MVAAVLQRPQPIQKRRALPPIALNRLEPKSPFFFQQGNPDLTKLRSKILDFNTEEHVKLNRLL